LNNLSVIIPLIGISSLLPAVHLPYSHWLTITADQWVLEVVRGYKLKLISMPVQVMLPRVIESKKPHLISEEVHKLLTKGAIKMVLPHQDQFLRRIFVIPKKDGAQA